MSQNLTALQITQFEAEVHHEFRTVADNFEDLARTRRVEGGEVQFPVFGYNKMNPHQMGQMIQPANGTRRPVKFALEEFTIGDWTDIFKNANVNFDEKAEFIKTIVDAFKNCSAQRIINALDAATLDQVPANVSGSTDNLTVDAVIKAGQILDEKGVPNDGNRILMVSASGVASLMKDPRVTSMDFVSQQALMSGKLDNFYGFKVRMFGEMAEGGLPKSGNIRRSYAYHQSAVGYGANITQKVDVQYYNTYAAWFVAGAQSCAAKVIDERGCVEILTDESVA